MCKSICMCIFSQESCTKTTIDMSIFLVLYINFIKNNKSYRNYLKYSMTTSINNNYSYSYDCRLYYLILIFKIDNFFVA